MQVIPPYRELNAQYAEQTLSGIGRGAGEQKILGGHCQTQLVRLCVVLPFWVEPRASRFVSAPVTFLLQQEHKALQPWTSDTGTSHLLLPDEMRLM